MCVSNGRKVAVASRREHVRHPLQDKYLGVDGVVVTWCYVDLVGGLSYRCE